MFYLCARHGAREKCFDSDSIGFYCLGKSYPSWESLYSGAQGFAALLHSWTCDVECVEAFNVHAKEQEVPAHLDASNPPRYVWKIRVNFVLVCEGSTSTTGQKPVALLRLALSISILFLFSMVCHFSAKLRTQ